MDRYLSHITSAVGSQLFNDESFESNDNEDHYNAYNRLFKLSLTLIKLNIKLTKRSQN